MLNLKIFGMDKIFKRNGLTLLFYQKPEDEKYSFLIENQPELTEKILSSVRKKRIEEKDLSYAQRAIFQLIESGNLTLKDQVEKDYISLVKNQLAHLSGMTMKNVPEELPLLVGRNGVTFSVIFCEEEITKTASNKKIAKQLCYKEVWEKHFSNY